MTKINEVFKLNKRTFSFEIFPPKTEQGYVNLLSTIGELCSLNPDFISCTYGAGGGSREKTLDIVEYIQKHHSIPALAHLTCVLHTKDEIYTILKNIKARGVQNVLALRGDPPIDNPSWVPGEENFLYCKDLCAFIRQNFGDYFTIGVAGFPEGHVLCRDGDRDAEYLKMKIDNGADFIITQFFFDNNHYFNYVERLRSLGITKRVIPGVLPIVSYDGLIKFSKLGGVTITQEVNDIFSPIKDDSEALIEAGKKFAVKQCNDLLNGGAPGIHLYCLNKLHPAKEIFEAIR